MLVIIVTVLRFDVAVLKSLSLWTTRRKRGGFWVWGGSLSVILSRDERGGTVGAGGGCAEGEESSSRSDCLNQMMDVGYRLKVRSELQCAPPVPRRHRHRRRHRWRAPHPPVLPQVGQVLRLPL